MNPSQVFSDLETEAKNLGFLLVGSVPLHTPRHFHEFSDWIRRGYQGEMAYLSTERSIDLRKNPGKLFPEARTILVLALPYFHSNLFPPPAPSGFWGRVASYAWGKDYHELIPRLLDRYLVKISKIWNFPIYTKIFTDSAPILEKDIAQEAGLGWIGKNTCLITPRIGSYYLLAEMFIDQKIESNAPFTHDYCGNCTRCIEACPTQCILPDRVIDARRCLSYLTIEKKGAIPKQLRKSMGNWIFGCDCCQIVCPWNHFPQSYPVLPDLSPNLPLPFPNLIEIIQFTPAEFAERFRLSPIWRAKRKGLIRNAIVALGNLADPSTAPVLGNLLLGDSEPLIRQHSAWALGEIATRNAKSFLQKAAITEMDSDVIAEINAALDH